MIANDVTTAEQLISLIEKRLACERSQRNRQLRRRSLSPSLSYGRHFAPPLPTARPAAVMLLLEPRGNAWTIPLTIRPTHLPDHPGQICLPGGRLEVGETPQEAAEREFCEELGLSEFPGVTLGALQNIYVYNSDFYLTPFISVINRALEYSPSPDEVESVIHLPLDCLTSEANLKHEIRSRGSVRWNSPGIAFEGHHVWGATAIVLADLAGLLQATL